MTDEPTTPDGGERETVHLQFDQVTTVTEDGDQTSSVHLSVETEQTESADEPTIEWRDDSSEFHQRLLDACEQEGIRTDVVDFPMFKQAKTDENGHVYVGDLNGLVRYYLGAGEVETTEKYDELATISDEATQRENDLHQMVHHSP